MTRLPGHAFDIPLAGRLIEVHWVEGLRDDGEDCYGLWDPDLDRISLDITQNFYKARETLIHELAHALSDTFDLDLSERECQTLGAGLGQSLGILPWESLL